MINEDPKVSTQASNKNNNSPFDHEELDDLMFDMTAPNTKQANNSKNKNSSNMYPSTPGVGNNTYVSENGQAKDSWFKEEELMRKKLEKGAIN